MLQGPTSQVAQSNIFYVLEFLDYDPSSNKDLQYVIWSLAGTRFHKQLIIVPSGCKFYFKYFWAYTAMANNQAKYKLRLIRATKMYFSLLVPNLLVLSYFFVWKAYLKCLVVMNPSVQSADILTDMSGLWHRV